MRKSLISTIAVIALAGAFYACAPRDGADRFPLKGKIDGIDLVDREVLVSHEAIPGFMPAMTMPIKLPKATGMLASFRGMQLEQLRRGDVITATLAVTQTESWLEGVEVVRYEPPPSMPAPPPKESKAGEPVVDVLLQDQDAKEFHLSDYRGHPLALTFIYTRCPLPEFCPRIMKNFQELEKGVEADPQLRENARLLSISFDVDFDKPEVLHAFGSAFVTDRGEGPFARWKLATGTKESIDRIGRFFGLVFFKEGEQFSHSLVTAVIGADGKLVREWSGNDWQPTEALVALREAAAKAAAEKAAPRPR